MLPEEKRVQLDGIVQEMITNKEPDSNIKFVVDDFKKKYSVNESASVAPKKDLLQKVGGVVNKIFPGQQVGEAIGTFAGAAYTGAKDLITGRESNIENYDISAPSPIQVVADVAQGALSVAGLKTVGTGSLLKQVGQESALGYGFDISEGLKGGRGEGRTGVKSLIPGAGTAFAGVAPLGIKGVGVVKRKVDDILADLMPVKESALNAAGRIVQGTTKERSTAMKALSQLGDKTKNIKTYEDLYNVLEKAARENIEIVEKEFTKIPSNQTKKLNALAQTVEATVDGRILRGEVNYVEDSLNQLKELYSKTQDVENLLRIELLTEKAKNVGLHPSEINSLSKEYGREFKAKGFNKIGQPLTSINDQAYENTRKGLKTTARNFLESDTAKLADQKASELINTQKLVDKMRQRVLKLQQRVNERGVVEKAARGLASAIDIATLGGPKAFVTKLLFPSGAELKTLNSIDLQNQLSKNLKIIEDMNSASDKELRTIFQKLFGK